jgi:predicted RNA-binding Zn-ribbon protein involved in translation (DUF1610 family)
MTVRPAPSTLLLILVAAISMLSFFPRPSGTARFAPQSILTSAPETVMSYQAMQVSTISLETRTSAYSETYFQTYTSTESLPTVQENTPLIAAVSAIGGAAVGYSLNKGRRRLGNKNTCPTCGGTGRVSSTLPIQPGLQPVSPIVGPGQTPAIGPGSQPIVNPVSPGLFPFPVPHVAEKCVHCGKPIRLGLQFCPNCGIRASSTRSP